MLWQRLAQRYVTFLTLQDSAHRMSMVIRLSTCMSTWMPSLPESQYFPRTVTTTSAWQRQILAPVCWMVHDRWRWLSTVSANVPVIHRWRRLRWYSRLTLTSALTLTSIHRRYGLQAVWCQLLWICLYSLTRLSWVRMPSHIHQAYTRTVCWRMLLHTRSWTLRMWVSTRMQSYWQRVQAELHWSTVSLYSALK